MPKIGSDALRDLPVVGTLLGVVVIAALGLAYWGNVTSRERYLQSRNFRLLADVAEQSQTMLYDSEQTRSPDDFHRRPCRRRRRSRWERSSGMRWARTR